MQEFLVVSVVLAWIAILGNFFLILAVIRTLSELKKRHGQISDDELLKLGDPAPQFSARNLEAQVMHLKDFINKTTVLVFISPSCAPCRAKLPSIQAVFATQSIDIELVLVSTGSHNATKALTDELEITLPVLVAPEHENTFRQDYKVPATPFFILINDKGYVGYRGFLNEAWDQLVENWQQDVAIHA